MIRRLLPLVALLASCSLIGAGAGAAPASPAIANLTATTLADTATVRVRCAVPAETTCRWQAAVGVLALPAAPDGLEATYRFVAPAPGDSVQITGTARAVRRGLLSAGVTPWSAWIVRADTPPGAPDSVIVVEIIMPPVGP